MSPLRKPDPVPEDRISDRRQLNSMVNGAWAGWEELNPKLGRAWPKPTAEEYEDAKRRELKDSHATSRIPYDFLEEVAMSAKVDAWRRRQHERLRFLLLSDVLAGDALDAALRMKREHEGREWNRRATDALETRRGRRRKD